MGKFTIVYEQELYDALSPLDAAKKVRQDIIDGEALCFTVINEETNEKFSVDLGEDDNDAVVIIKEDNTNIEFDETVTLLKDISAGSMQIPLDVDFEKGDVLIVKDINLITNKVICSIVGEDENELFAFDLKEFNNAIKIYE